MCHTGSVGKEKKQAPISLTKISNCCILYYLSLSLYLSWVMMTHESWLSLKAVILKVTGILYVKFV